MHCTVGWNESGCPKLPGASESVWPECVWKHMWKQGSLDKTVDRASREWGGPDAETENPRNSYESQYRRIPPCHQPVNLMHMALQSNHHTADVCSAVPVCLSVRWHLGEGSGKHAHVWTGATGCNNSVNQLCRFNLVSGVNQMHGIKWGYDSGKL